MRNIVFQIFRITAYIFVTVAVHLNAQSFSNRNPSIDESVEQPSFSHQRGIYTDNFILTISVLNPEAIIKYTFDGSDPSVSLTALQQDTPALINIDPESTEGNRGRTPGVIIRACTVLPDLSVSKTITRTFLFVNKAAELSPEGVKPGPGWPQPAYYPQYMDYGMSPAVTNDSRYKDLIDDALLSIPSYSLVTDLKNLFDPSAGIYVNALEEGTNWERPASVELIYPDGREGFQIDCGVRIRGGWSAHGDNPKHAFRLFFRNEYGTGKLKYPLFEDEGTDEFDNIDLRTSQNYSWSYPGHLGEYNTMNRDVFARDLQGKTGNQYTRSRYCHLYINGVYWGLFQTQERSEASYAESYFGGSAEDYDVIKISSNYTVEATDGNTNAWRTIWNYCTAGFSNNHNYFSLQGKNADGTPNPALKNLVDIDNLIDYMLNIFYTGNYDSPCSKFGSNKGPNNFFAIYNRNGNDGFQFFIHDAEHTLRTTSGEGPGIGLMEDRVNIGDLTDNYKMVVSNFSQFHPQWLHYKLSKNAEYKIRFSDHVYKHFLNDGWMSPKKASELFNKRASEIETAIIGESARWGNTYANPARTKDDDWKPAIDDIVKKYFPYRTAIVLNQLKYAGLYPSIDPPLLQSGEELIQSEIVNIDPGYKLKIKNPNLNKGTVVYTLNGEDPRLIGGGMSPNAVDAGNETEIALNSTTIVKTRVLDNLNWSALHEVIFFTPDDYSNLKITEIHYHPSAPDTVDEDEYEFIELKNIGATPINLSNCSFSAGIEYQFSENTIIDGGGFLVLCEDIKKFNERYGFYPLDKYSGKLDNGGETITLNGPDSVAIISITYDDNSPWPEEADGLGFSLVPKDINPVSDLNDPANWRASYYNNGSPMADDLITGVDEILNSIPDYFGLSQNYPNPFNPVTIINYTVGDNETPKEIKVTLKIYDLLGRQIAVLVDEYKKPGTYSLVFNSERYSLSSGVYFYRLSAGKYSAVKKMIFLK